MCLVRMTIVLSYYVFGENDNREIQGFKFLGNGFKRSIRVSRAPTLTFVKLNEMGYQINGGDQGEY